MDKMLKFCLTMKMIMKIKKKMNKTKTTITMAMRRRSVELSFRRFEFSIFALEKRKKQESLFYSFKLYAFCTYLIPSKTQ